MRLLASTAINSPNQVGKPSKLPSLSLRLWHLLTSVTHSMTTYREPDVGDAAWCRMGWVGTRPYGGHFVGRQIHKPVIGISQTVVIREKEIKNKAWWWNREWWGGRSWGLPGKQVFELSLECWEGRCTGKGARRQAYGPQGRTYLEWPRPQNDHLCCRARGPR